MFLEYILEILDFKKDQSISLIHKSENHSINIRIKGKSIISINVLGLNTITNEQKKHLISNGFKGFEGKNGNPWKISSDFSIELLANEDSRNELIKIFNKLISETIISMK